MPRELRKDREAGSLFDGTDEIRALCRSIDWSATPLGPVESWPPSLRAAVRLCLDSRTTMVIWAGPELTVIHNQGYRPMLGPRYPRAMGRPGREVWPERWDLFAPKLKEVLRGVASREDEVHYRLQGDDGFEDAWFNFSLTPIREEDGRIVGVLKVIEDTTGHVRSLRYRSEQFETLLDHAPCGVYLVDADLRFAEVNPIARRLFSHTPDLIGHTLTEVIHARWPEARGDEIAAIFRHTLETGEPYHAPESREPRTDGAVVAYEWCINRITLPDGRHGAVCYFTDISEQVRAREKIAESERRYRTLFECIDEGFCIVEVLFDAGRPVDYRFIEVNPAFEEQTGLHNATGRCIRELVPQHESKWFETYGRVALTGEPVRFESRAEAMGRYYDVFAFRVGAPGQNRVAILFDDVSDRKRAEQALREADRRKDHFMAVLSHELRNPLAPIKNSLHILERAALGGEQERHAKEVIGRQIDQLAHLVDDLLDVTRITSGKIQLQLARVELRELVKRTLEDHRSLLEKSGLEVGLQTSSHPTFIHCDANRIAQVVSNLLQNAAKFTPRGGRVTVSVSTEEATRQAVVRVRDTGAGIAPEMLPRLFEPFAQADATLDRSKGGLGLGLALVRGLVEQHRGSVTAASEGLGRGAEIIVRLPLDLTGTASAGPPSTHANRARRRVLVIEDNVDAADTLREVLEMDGHEVTVAYSGADGIVKARQFHPDFVLCDIGLPGMDGYEVARAFRADETLRSAHLVALTGYALPEDLQRAAAAGFEKHLAKPPQLDKLEDVLEHAGAH